MSFYLSLSGGDYVESILISVSILKLLLANAGGNFSIFVVMIPQESGTGAGGSLSKNWPRRPRHSYKTSHWREMRLLILDLWSFWVNEAHMRNSMEGTRWSEFDGIRVEDWTCAPILSWSSYYCKQDWVTAQYSLELQRISRLPLSPNTLPGGLGDRLKRHEKLQTRFSTGVAWEE